MLGSYRVLKAYQRWVLTTLLVIATVIETGSLAYSHNSVLNDGKPMMPGETSIVAQVVSTQVQYEQPDRSEFLSQRTILGFFQAQEAIDWVYRLSFTVITTLALIIVLMLLKRLLKRAHKRIHDLEKQRSLAFKIQNLQILPSESVTQGLLSLASLIRLSLSLLAFAIYLSILPNFFPQTEAIGREIQAYVLGGLSVFWNGIISYLPHLIAIILVGIATYYILQFLSLIFNALERGQVSIPGFYKEWIQPTYRLAQALTLLIALAMIIPNLPGFGSPAFQGLSLLIGALLTLGGASTISNLIGGFIMIYTRAFQVGDRIRIGGYTGNVLEKSIMSTRIRTSTNEIITVPNSNVMASNIVNYTATLRELEKPLVLYTTVILGYEVSWRKVHQALIAAAQSTPFVLEEPAPFVYQTSLNSCYVTYELRVYTRQVDEMSFIYSQLRQNILDQFDANDIPTLSPEYLDSQSADQSLSQFE